MNPDVIHYRAAPRRPRKLCGQGRRRKGTRDVEQVTCPTCIEKLAEMAEIELDAMAAGRVIKEVEALQPGSVLSFGFNPRRMR